MVGYEYLYELPRVDFCGRGLHYVPMVYYGMEHPRQHMSFLYKDAENAKKPVVVWIHGGAWDDEYLTSDYRHDPTLAALAEKGFFVVCLEYRLARHEAFPACLEDCALALRYLEDHAKELGIDCSRVGLWGESAGAHIACMVASDKRYRRPGIRSVVSFYCPSDLVEEVRFLGELSFVVNVLPKKTLDEEAQAAWLRQQSPLTYAGEPDLPAILLMHGDCDETVNYDQSVAYERALLAAGNRARLVTVPGQGHGFFRGQKWYDEVISFLEETL